MHSLEGRREESHLNEVIVEAPRGWKASWLSVWGQWIVLEGEGHDEDMMEYD